MSNKNKSAFFDKKYLTRVLAYAAVSLFVVGVIFYLGYLLRVYTNVRKIQNIRFGTDIFPIKYIVKNG